MNHTEQVNHGQVNLGECQKNGAPKDRRIQRTCATLKECKQALSSNEVLEHTLNPNHSAVQDLAAPTARASVIWIIGHYQQEVACVSGE